MENQEERRFIVRRIRRLAVASAACAVAASAGAIALTSHSVRMTPTASVQSATLDPARGTGAPASRGYVRPAKPAPAKPRRPARPAHHRPVAGLTQAQTDNAATIVRVGRARRLPHRALVVAIACAMQESNLRNTASRAVPRSLRYPHQGVSTDADSVGLFQQRPSQGWGSVAELMNPTISARKFYSALVHVRSWQSMSVTGAAQAVQRSAFPNAYAKHQARAERIVAAL